MRPRTERDPHSSVTKLNIVNAFCAVGLPSTFTTPPNRNPTLATKSNVK